MTNASLPVVRVVLLALGTFAVLLGLLTVGACNTNDAPGNTDWYDNACVPDCVDRQCGDDGCGGTCGECGCGEECGTQGQCEFTACDGDRCGDDGCGGTCGECACGECGADGYCSAWDQQGVLVLHCPTGRYWERSVGSAEYEHDAALLHCSDLDVAGISNWILPEWSVLDTLRMDVPMDNCHLEPAFDGPCGKYWTSTGDGLFQYVNFANDGSPGGSASDNSDFSVRCVSL